MTQGELAELSGVSAVTISRLEAGNDQPSARTRTRILRAFEKQGLIFMNRGFEMTDSPVFFIDGKTEEECYLRLLDDVHEHIGSADRKELLIMYADDRVSPPSVNAAYRKMLKEGVRIRQLIEEGNDYIMGMLDDYRLVPGNYFINRVTLIYGERIANMTTNLTRAVVRVDRLNAYIHKNTFELLWNILEQPGESHATERF